MNEETKAGWILIDLMIFAGLVSLWILSGHFINDTMDPVVDGVLIGLGLVCMVGGLTVWRDMCR